MGPMPRPNHPPPPSYSDQFFDVKCPDCGYEFSVCDESRSSEPMTPVFIDWICGCGHATKAEHEAAGRARSEKLALAFSLCFGGAMLVVLAIVVVARFG